MVARLSSLDVCYLVKELSVLVNAKIDNAFAEDDLLVLQIKTAEGKKFLHCNKEVIFLSDEKSIEQTQEHMFCRQLRQQITGRQIINVVQQASERLIRIDAKGKEDTLTLIIELFGGGNVLLLK